MHIDSSKLTKVEICREIAKIFKKQPSDQIPNLANTEDIPEIMEMNPHEFVVFCTRNGIKRCDEPLIQDMIRERLEKYFKQLLQFRPISMSYSDFYVMIINAFKVYLQGKNIQPKNYSDAKFAEVIGDRGPDWIVDMIESASQLDRFDFIEPLIGTELLTDKVIKNSFSMAPKYAIIYDNVPMFYWLTQQNKFLKEYKLGISLLELIINEAAINILKSLEPSFIRNNLSKLYNVNGINKKLNEDDSGAIEVDTYLKENFPQEYNAIHAKIDSLDSW